MKYLCGITLFLAVALPMVQSFVTVDNFSFTHGLSVGTDTHYCSVEIEAGISCEVAS